MADQSVVMALLPAISVTIVSLIFGERSARKLESLRTQLSNQSGFFSRNLEKHEQLWPLIAKSNRLQMSVARLKRDGRDYSDQMQQLAEGRRLLKNFVYDNALYFGTSTEQLIQELDSRLADPLTDDVNREVAELEKHLERVISEATAPC